MSSIFDKTVDVLSRSLDLYLLRHSVISDNIANAETPGFKSRRVGFEDALQQAATDQNSPSAIQSVSAQVYEDPLAEVGQDRNTVDMDREMTQMAKNETKYSAVSQAINKKFALLRYAILGGDR